MLGRSGFGGPQVPESEAHWATALQAPCYDLSPWMQGSPCLPWGGLPRPSAGPNKGDAVALRLGNISPPTAGVEI